jgi:polar amino acid transport system substrate-binding protein
LRNLVSIAVLAAVLVYFVCSSPAQAQETIQVSFNPYPPAVTVDADGNPQGYDIRLLELLAERLGLRIEYHHYPFSRGLRLMESGEIDMMIGVLRRPEREKYLFFVQPPYQKSVSTAFYVRKGEEGRIRSHADLYGLKIGTGIGVRYYPRFDADARLDKDAVRAGLMNFKRLIAGRVDAVVMNEEVGDYRVVADGFQAEIGKAEYVHVESQEVHVVLSKKSRFAPRLEEFNRVMAELLAEGARQRLKAEYLRERADED